MYIRPVRDMGTPIQSCSPMINFPFMSKIQIILPVLSVIPHIALACPIGSSGPSRAEQDAMARHSAHSLKRKVAAKIGLPVLPTAQNNPWGGPTSERWKPEAIVANAVSHALNEGWKTPDVQEVLVSVPAKMVPTPERPYGDGQTNATLNFGEIDGAQAKEKIKWSAREPQLVATLLKFKDGRRVVEFRFSEALGIKELKGTVTSFADKRRDEPLSLKKEGKGYRGVWNVPKPVSFGGIEGPRVAWVQIKMQTKSSPESVVFPIDFRIPILKDTELAKAAGNAKTTGLPPLDPIKAKTKAQGSGKVVQDFLKSTHFGPEWIRNNQGGDYFVVENIHAEVLGGIKTAVGGGLTWVINRGPHSTFKNLYTCFDSRNLQQETAEGVPSGSGWHEIGDAAETIFNSLEDNAILVGHATGHPAPGTPDNLKYAWDLKDIMTFRLLMPGEAMMTGAGEVTWKEDEAARPTGDWTKATRTQDKSGRGRNYHWFIFHSGQPVCTQEWVHICRPVPGQLGLESKTDPDCSPK